MKLNLLRLNIWRKGIIVAFFICLALMFGVDWGYKFHVGHIVRLAVGFGAGWLAVDRL